MGLLSRVSARVLAHGRLHAASRLQHVPETRVMTHVRLYSDKASQPVRFDWVTRDEEHEVGTRLEWLEVYKDEPVHVMEDEWYPEWLWTALDEHKPELEDLQHKNWDQLDSEEKKRLLKLERRSEIKERNFLSRKK